MEVVGSVTIAELATKSDIRDLRLATQSDIRDVRSELKTEIAEFRAEVKTEFAEFRAEVKTEFAEVRTEMAELKHDLTRTFATMLFVSQGVLVSIVALLVHFA